MTTLETRDLTIRFGGHVAVNGVSCSFRPGELTAIVGPNGAGKTTYFNLISGQLRPTEGSILFDGADITKLSAPLRTRAALGRAFQLTNLFPNLSVEENVRLAVQSQSGVHYDMLRPWMTRKDLIARADAILDKVALGARRNVAATVLSHGDQRKLEVALMMALEPKVFMFDEPTAGMSIDEVPVVLNLIAQLKQDASKIILLVEHKMDVVRWLADRIIVLTNGQLVADGKPAEVIASPIVQEAYLGIAPGKSAACPTFSPSPACTPISGGITSCTASISRCPKARPPCCLAAMAPARPRRCEPSWACGRHLRGGYRSTGKPSSTARPRISPGSASVMFRKAWRCSPI